MVATAPFTQDQRRVTYHPYGGSRELMRCKDPEVLLEGPAGTGKSYACLWKMHTLALKYPGMRGLMVRKTLLSLTSTAVVTYRNRVLASGRFGVTFYGGSKAEPAAFRYPNGSQLLLGGMDKPDKIMSSEYDIAFVNESTELTLEDWEKITTRLRNGVIPYQQIIADCNPQMPTHWLNQRANDGVVTRLGTRHEDNPRYWDHGANDWTDEGQNYIAKLDRLTGVRYQRLRLGKWVAAEGQVYEGWNPDMHLIPRFDIPTDWPRYWVIDFGFVHPFVWQWWAQGPDGALYRYREIYMTRRLVEDHAAQGLALSANEPRPVAVITDHDAEDRATFEKHARVRTVAAKKSVSDGIQAVAARLRPEANGRPRLFFLRDALVERDRDLADAAQPTCTEEEFPSYVWPDAKPGAQRKADEQPVKEYDHGMDTTRYVVAHFDLQKRLAVTDSSAFASAPETAQSLAQRRRSLRR